ncbi:hypothetical protein DPMN_169908 [Dreissena polymorpha]|uniref:Uncharacterized protein n=1 Tax=Dreissena polymorpha TaxID=45954 RepID=A0A9D4DYJ5_DREPO|nr:hypothetical protein DPMN_169908 [Dreissena polymorpha]
MLPSARAEGLAGDMLFQANSAHRDRTIHEKMKEQYAQGDRLIEKQWPHRIYN